MFDAMSRAAPHARAGAQQRDVFFDALFTRLERLVYGYLWRMLGD